MRRKLYAILSGAASKGLIACSSFEMLKPAAANADGSQTGGPGTAGTYPAGSVEAECLKIGEQYNHISHSYFCRKTCMYMSQNLTFS